MKKDYNEEDVKFVQMMIPHHESAVSASATEFSRGENAETALRIYLAPKEEIAKLMQWLKERGITAKAPGGM